MDSSNSSSMFSSMFIDSIMNTSMQIAQECLVAGGGGVDLDDTTTTTTDNNDPTSSPPQNKSSSSSNALLGLEAFASTIDSILSRIKITLEQIQIRVENLDGSSLGCFDVDGSSGGGGTFMSSSTIFNPKPSNGVALELRIKSIKYFDLDSVNSGSTNEQTATSGNVNKRNIS